MDNDIEQLKTKISKLEHDIDVLKKRRIYQQDIIPDGVKQRHMGESNRYVWAGLEADLPDGVSLPSSVVAYFCTDSNKWSVWNGTAFVSVILA